MTIEQIEAWIKWSREFLLALILGFTLAYGWFWIHVIFQNLMNYGPGSQDMGLAVLIPGWFWAVCWGGVVCFPLARIFIGTSSWAAYISSCVLFPLALFIFQFVVAIFKAIWHINYQQMETKYIAWFDTLGLGILREGRVGWASSHAYMFLAILAVGFCGFLGTFKNQPKVQ